MTTEEFIAKAKSIHGDKCDYSKVQYVSSHSKVTIICPDHGSFEQKPNGHLNGHGCPQCANGGTTKTTEQFIAEARKVHGYKYDYSKVEYKNSYSKVTIICPDHGSFEQSPPNHTRDRGCSACGREANKKATTKTTEQFIAEARKVHGYKYDYSKVEYKNSYSKVTIICPDHGSFEQRPSEHTRDRGHPSAPVKRRVKTTEEFITKAKKVHGDKYNYSKVEYVNTKTEIIITCPEHGEFWQQPRFHLGGSNCLSCARDAKARKARKTTEQFIAEARKVHGDKYDYSKVEYVNTKTEIVITCLEHGDFEQRPDVHLLHSGCPRCAIEEKRRTTEQFITKAKEVHGDKYDYSKVQYVGGRFKVIIICPDHGDFEQLASNHLRGQGCSQCAENLISEPIFRKILEEATSLKFPKKRPKWLRNPNTNSLLELDCYNQKTKIAFELQGGHHYGPIEHWGGEETFQKVLQRDQIKKTICEEKGIHLFCIDQRPATSKPPQEKEEYYKKEIKKCLCNLPEDVIIKIGVDDED